MSFISPENTWALWTVLVCSAALAIYLEQKYKWANKVSGCILAVTFTLILANLNVIPTDAPVYDAVWGYVVPLAVPMLLFRANLFRIGKDSGRLLIIYLFSSLGTLLGGFIAYFALNSVIPFMNDIIPMFTATYTGGSVNFVAMSATFKVSNDTVSAALVADNLLMALYFFTLIALPSIGFIRRAFKTPYIDKLEKEEKAAESENKTMAAKYWGAKEISLFDIGAVVALAFLIVTISSLIADSLKNLLGDTVVGLFLGNKYLVITTLTMILATVFHKQFQKINGSQEIGTFLIYIFFAVIGAPASIGLIIQESPILLLLALIIVVTNMIVSLVFGKLFKFDLEEVIIASNANVGGPTTAAAMAVSKGWVELIVPALLVGTLGYVLGNYFGIFIGSVVH